MALLLLLAIVVAFFAPVLFSHYIAVPWDERTFEPWGSEAAAAGEKAASGPGLTADPLLSYYPRRVALHEALRERRLPLWSGASFCGAPFLANFQSGALYPPNWILALLTPERATGAFLALHVFLLGGGALLFLRDLGVGRAAAVGGAIACSWNGFVVARFAHPTAVATLAWLPLLLWATRRLARHRSAAAFAGCALVCAHAILAGFPPILVYVAYAVATFAVVCAWPAPGRADDRDRGGTSPLLRIAICAAALALGAGLAAPQLFATAELARFSDRAEIPYDSVLSSAIHPALAIRLVAPSFFGDPFASDDLSHAFSRGDGHYAQTYLSSGVYLGATILALALVGSADRRRETRWLVVMAVVGLLLAYGSPLLRLFWMAAPGFRIARIDRAIALTTVSAGLLAGIGLDRLAGARRFIAGAAIAAALFGAAAAIGGARGGADLVRAFVPGAPASAAPIAARALVRPALACAALAVTLLVARRTGRAPALLCIPLLLVDLGSFALRVHRPRDGDAFLRESAGLAFLRERTAAARARGEGAPRIVRFGDEAATLVPPNLPGLFGLEDVQGYNALEMGYYMRTIGAIEADARRDRRILPLRRRESLDSPLFRLLAAPMVVSNGPIGAGETLYAGADLSVTEVPTLPRAFLVHHAVRVDSLERALAAIAGAQVDPRLTAIVMEADVASMGLDAEPRGQEIGESVRWIESPPERIRLRVTANDAALLCLSEIWYPGWRARANGRALPLVRVNGAFRGVPVPAGTHDVELRYEPGPFRAGVWVALVAAAGLAAGALVLRRAGRRVSSSSPPCAEIV